MTEKMNIVEAINAALHDEMEENEDVIVYGEDVGEDGGVFRATKELQEEFGEERCFSSPLAESGIAGTAIGMSLYGFNPVVEMQFSGFSYLAFHQIKEHAARFRMRSRGDYTSPITVRAPYGGGINALEHHQESPETFFAHSKGIHTVIPSTPQDAYSLLRKSIQKEDPVMFLEPKKTYRAFKEEVDRDKKVELNDCRIAQEGNDLTLISWGAMIPLAEEAAEEVDADIEIIDVRTIQPNDYDEIVESIEKTGRAAILHEDSKTGGMGGDIAGKLQEDAILHMEAPVERITAPDVPYPLYTLEEEYMPDKDQVVNGIREVLEF
ncbi:alpha-ketoacid dehydrogenase subunit beta [Candidatus Nanohalobium constans]|uniref:3-methyl-2-oxobutanoate dehydrogenase (2-methylpropanoyl-transferring) n=1 Tax=Candidatus Nanohalobium constans TaxID=2565781 RepID=A0A5Q0UEQ7_9ARCH|nr:alpha-ketoacid dehydrogenase subunit beta [Candidatus Nanohalobium constans]QGA79964.1 pyruvate dehydrogenase E1 component beta subunit [Candidatus Nanohalobium constans]